jgi:hypothetical protein
MALSQRNSLYEQYGGWRAINSGTTTTAIPVKPVILPTDKSSIGDANAQSKMCLTEYLNSVTTNYANTVFSQYSKLEFVSGGTNSNGQQIGSLKLFIPKENAYQSSMVNIRFPTELADTIVDRPAISSFDLSAKWQSTGTDHAQASNVQKLDVTVTNTGTVTATGNLMETWNNAKVGIYPLGGSITLNAGESKVVTYTISNLGVLNQETDIPITISIKDAYTATQTDSVTVYITLLPTLIHDQTQLTVYAVEKSANASFTKTPIPGIALQVLYPSSQPTETKTGYTGTSGTALFNLDMNSGGGYTGEVLIQSSETSVYKSAQTTASVVGGQNEVYLEVERKDTVYPEEEIPWLMIALIVGIIAVIVGIAATAIYVKKKKPRRYRR